MTEEEHAEYQNFLLWLERRQDWDHLMITGKSAKKIIEAYGKMVLEIEKLKS